MKAASHPLKVAIIGGGYTGLAAARRLAKSGRCEVTLLERGSSVGGLAGDFTIQGEPIEKAYHHLFRTDREILALVEEMGLTAKLEWRESSVGVLHGGQTYPFLTPQDLLRFKPCSFWNRLRLGLVALYLQRTRDWRPLARQSASQWMRRACGPQAMAAVWEPLLRGKFHRYADRVSMAWLWARIYNRSHSRDGSGREKLGYFRGGLGVVANQLASEAQAAGAAIRLNTPVAALQKGATGPRLLVQGEWTEFDRVIFTGPSGALAELLADAPGTEAYRRQLQSIAYLGAVSLVFATEQKLGDYYWLNVTEAGAPFVVFIRHTRMVDAARYGGKEIYYIGAYQPHDGAAFCQSEEALTQTWFDYLQKIFPKFDRTKIVEKRLFKLRHAQHVVDTAYESRIPEAHTPVPGLFLSNFSQVYPEDRGTNFAVREGHKIADLILQGCG
ncbi:MAG TPA: NAD(P)/FAD-dependent oxidoreductase [Verrucomicrobiae bacterium]|jgi:protoporphyrinogen oxidase|nr:NAD(P)/FAD-dependent oxidoreductase [Verrucomicrobiae bacterium]